MFAGGGPWLREVDADFARTDNGAIRRSSRRDTMISKTDHAEPARADWSTLIPHKGAMCLLDDVVAWNPDAIHARSDSHRDPANPLRSDDRLRALHLCEYGAQAMAVHGGLVARAAGGKAEPGFLVSLRAVELAVDCIDNLPGAIDVHAERLLGGEGSWQYAFRVEHAGVTLASGRAAVIAARQPADAT
jgi:predicted hotdog family 3-hydroxylacyl-ACP dehydratase